MSHAAIDPDDYLVHGQHELFAKDITDRIDELARLIRESKQDGGEPFVEDEQEYQQLVAFRDLVQQVTGNHFDEATIVPADEFEDHARDWANGIADIEWLESYVDWPQFARDLQSDRYIEVDFGTEHLVYVR